MKKDATLKTSLTVSLSIVCMLIVSFAMSFIDNVSDRSGWFDKIPAWTLVFLAESLVILSSLFLRDLILKKTGKNNPTSSFVLTVIQIMPSVVLFQWAWSFSTNDLSDKKFIVGLFTTPIIGVGLFYVYLKIVDFFKTPLPFYHSYHE